MMRVVFVRAMIRVDMPETFASHSDQYGVVSSHDAVPVSWFNTSTRARVVHHNSDSGPMRQEISGPATSEIPFGNDSILCDSDAMVPIAMKDTSIVSKPVIVRRRRFQRGSLQKR